MRLSHQSLEQMARLVQLRLDDNSLTELQRSLSHLISQIDTIKTLDTQGVAPLVSPLEITQRLRADQVTETDQRDRYQAIAPAVENGLYLVPKVLD